MSHQVGLDVKSKNFPYQKKKKYKFYLIEGVGKIKNVNESESDLLIQQIQTAQLEYGWATPARKGTRKESLSAQPKTIWPWHTELRRDKKWRGKKILLQSRRRRLAVAGVEVESRDPPESFVLIETLFPITSESNFVSPSLILILS